MELKPVFLLPLLATAALARCKPRTSIVTVTETLSPTYAAEVPTTLPTTAAPVVVVPESSNTAVDTTTPQQSSDVDTTSSTSSTSAAPQEQAKAEVEDAITASLSTTLTIEALTSSTVLATRVTLSATPAPIASSRAVPDKPIKTLYGAPNESEVLFDTPWIIFSMNYNYKSINGSAYTGLYEVTGTGADQKIH